MSVAHASIAAPFDALAERYDQTFTYSKIGRAQRSAVWKELAHAFQPGERVIEIGCGTGMDACFMAHHGVNVVATDSSAQMIAAARQRVTEEGKSRFVQPIVLAAEDLGELNGLGSFDGAFSNFGALNCVPDLTQFAHDLAVLLRPGATALLCWLGPCCLWEISWYLAQGNFAKAFRRMRRGGVTASLAAGATVRVQYPSVHSLARIFAHAFQLRSIHGIGVAVPPSYVESYANQFPRLFDLSVRADSLLGRSPGIRKFGDHILLEFQRKELPV